LSMVLNPKLVMTPKYAKLAPYLRKKKGCPTAKRVELLKAQQADERPFVDKARRGSVNVRHEFHSMVLH
jgi:hypothetical protein